jgi:PAS domain-containing protein
VILITLDVTKGPIVFRSLSLLAVPVKKLPKDVLSLKLKEADACGINSLKSNTENAADTIAVIDCAGNRLYNSPAYRKALGYSSEELK